MSSSTPRSSSICAVIVDASAGCAVEEGFLRPLMNATVIQPRNADCPGEKMSNRQCTRNMVHRDRNQPCVIIWSLGNESASYYTKSHRAMEQEYAPSTRVCFWTLYMQEFHARII